MFPIGTFSRLCQLSIRVLRHYDEIGLLKPAHTSRSNGYRYYTSEQLAEVHRIIALKELGLTLEQIKALTANPHSLQAIAQMLRLERLRAEEERTAAERRLRELDHRLSELSDLGRLSKIDVVEKSVAAMPLLAYRSVVADLEEAYTLMGEITARCAAFGPPSPFIGVAHDDFFDTHSLDLELGYPVERPARVDLGSGRVMIVRQLPAVERMLSVIYIGTQIDGHRSSHGALALWLERHECELAGPGRELIHGTPAGGEQTIEIQYPVASARL